MKRTKHFERYMLLVAIGGNGVFFAQAFEIFSTRSARDVSLTGFGIALWAAMSWLAYGCFIRNQVIIICNVLAVLGALSVVVGTLLYAS